MKIGLITTINTNIGDDFIREGIVRVLAQVYGTADTHYLKVNKHQPYMVYPPRHSIHLRKYLEPNRLWQYRPQRWFETFVSRFCKSNFHDCDLIVQCGAPVFWPNCYRNEWAKPLWYDIIGRLHQKIPVLNLAAGSCYPWITRDSHILNADDARYIKKILGYCAVTTVRDRLAHDLCVSLGVDVPVIPCSAFLAAKGRVAETDSSGYIVINYMRGGGHYDWSQGIDPQRWEQVVRDLVVSLGRRHRVVFLCHNEEERFLATHLNSSLQVFLPKDSREYFDFVAGAKFAICNRMHASVAMAGMGVPSVAICTDTRLLMVECLGLKTHYVADVNAPLLEQEVEDGLANLVNEKDRLLELQDQTWNRYLSVVREGLAFSCY
jgi:polysaccharide pyruvyl transferase WcaK-like protein